jgi:hypothetical protein
LRKGFGKRNQLSFEQLNKFASSDTEM